MKFPQAPPQSSLPFHQLLIMPQPRPLVQRGNKDCIQLGTVIENPRQRIPGLPRRSDPSVLPPVQHLSTCISPGAGRRQPFTLA